MTLFVTRHAPVAAEGLCYGRHDVPTLQGPEAAALAILEDLGERRTRVTAVWSSPALRCRLPAERLARSLAVPVRISNELQEIHYGAWEGQPWDQLEREDSKRFEHWMRTWRTGAPPGGETLDDLELRVRSWLAENAEAGRLVVGHAGVIRALCVVLRGLSWEDAMALDIEHLKVESFARSGRS